MPDGLTKMGYDDIITRIQNMVIRPPQDMNVETLYAWLKGYADAQNAVVEMIDGLKGQYGR